MDRKLQIIIKMLEDEMSLGWYEERMSHYRRRYLYRQKEYICRYFSEVEQSILFSVFIHLCAGYAYRDMDEIRKNNAIRQHQVERKKMVESIALETLKEHILGIQFGMGLKYRPIIPIVPLYNQSIFSAYDNKGDGLRVKGIYFLYNNKELVYIGSSKMILKRLHIHYTGKKIPFNGFKFMAMDDETMENIVREEYVLIKQFRPIHNKKMKP